MILPVYAYGTKVLRQETEEVDNTYPNLSKCIQDMWETMYHTDGVGIAAPQVGKNIRIFVMDTVQLVEDDPKDIERVKIPIKQVFINPIIIKEEGAVVTHSEGCLSIPGIREDVHRKEKVTIEYYDENFILHEKTFNGFTARVIQHEYDHLEGVLFTDLLKPLKRQMLKGRLAKIAKGDVDVDYMMRFQ